MTKPAYEATNSDVEKVEKKKYPSDNYLNEILTNTEFAAVVPIEAVRCMARELMLLRTPHPNGMMQLSNELAEMKRKCAELESRPLCVKSNDAMREVAPLCVKLPDSSSKAFWSGIGKTEQFHPETYKRWVKEAIERAGVIAGIKVEVK